jgi:hypothetical protein
LRLCTDGLLYNAGTEGFYWSSTVIIINIHNLTSFGMSNDVRALGFSVRCIKD